MGLIQTATKKKVWLENWYCLQLFLNCFFFADEVRKWFHVGGNWTRQNELKSCLTKFQLKNHKKLTLGTFWPCLFQVYDQGHCHGFGLKLSLPQVEDGIWQRKLHWKWNYVQFLKEKILNQHLFSTSFNAPTFKAFSTHYDKISPLTFNQQGHSARKVLPKRKRTY